MSLFHTDLSDDSLSPYPVISDPVPLANAEALALFVRLSSQPAAGWLTAMDGLITRGKANGWWAPLDGLIDFGWPSRTDAKLNWKGTLYSCSEVNGSSLTHAAKIGFAGNGTTATYLDTGYAPASYTYSTLADLNADLSPANNLTGQVIADPVPANNGTYTKSGASGTGSWSKTNGITKQWQINSATLGLYMGQDIASGVFACGNGNARLNPRTTTNNLQSRLNDGTNSQVTVSSAVGLSLVTRTASGAYKRFRDATALGDAAVTSTSVDGRALTFCGCFAAATYDARPHRMGFFGGGLTTQQAANMGADVAWYIAQTAGL